MPRPLVQGCVAAVLTLVVLAAPAGVRGAEPVRRPNVVLIVADDLGYGDVGAQGPSKDVRTPNIDSIASGGVRFTQGYVSCPVCAPTRAGLLTGQYQQRFGFEVNPAPEARETFGIPPQKTTLPEVLKAAGYKTGMVGKWHLGFQPAMHPTSKGFDEFFGFLAGAHGYLQVGQGGNVVMRGTEPLKEVRYLTDMFGEEAAAFVDRHKDGPFFLYLPFNAVHQPMQAPKEYLARFPDVKDAKRQKMLAMLSAMDDAIGRVLGRLEAHGLEDDTIVIFHSDNGGPTPGNASRNGPLRGSKGFVYEGGVRVPFLMRWPGRLKAGQVYEQPVTALDVFPTVLAAADVAAPADHVVDGVDLLPFLAGEKTSPPHETLFWRYGDRWAIRHGTFKLLSNGKPTAELYDLSTDVGEKNDLAAARPGQAAELRRQFDAWSAQMKPPAWADLRDAAAAKPGTPDDSQEEGALP